ncbi:formimidoylglutamate deiminase [Thalassotalea agarivorans]|uniref:Formimidoylglutamate deiminase n=1 Tax=Thalassotalea agarivorans TaxID=349064 RepID=A0A1I0CS06_THASX|nr:formimidoylglutamate deiminase [Thalassotalea agarivorans]SET21846.1 formimidoylglutamate deiminase [Thalassotalea agarivorans]
MKVFAHRVLLDSAWAKNKTLIIENGEITDIVDGQLDDAIVASGPVVPGLINCHSHAFQRAFAGFSEQGSEGQDSFWTWRKIMYQFLAQISDVEAHIIAKQLYIEMLKAGYTSVAEFHYLHHQQTGEPYPALAQMAKALFDAAQESGIGITMLPVLYQYSGFGEKAPLDGQKRFINTTEQFNQLVTDCYELSKQYNNANVGIAPHSLRATNFAAIEQAVKHVRSLDSKAPIHVHIAEQTQEVDDCIAHSGKRPVQWLCEQLSLDANWCLIHATHITADERKAIIDTGAVAGICPTTEANLGDGVFPTAEFMQEGGTIAIGSDSHISVNAVEEIRWLEYAQRLTRRQRAVLANKAQASVGLNLWQAANRGGALATNKNTGVLAVGKQADLLVLDQQLLGRYAQSDEHLLDSFVFATGEQAITDVMVNGQWVIRDKKHDLETQSHEAFSALLQRLSS